MSAKFDEWIRSLEEDVIQYEYGFEPGEFTVYREHWRPYFRSALTPSQAFKRALDAHAEAQREAERERLANWDRIKAADARAIAEWKGSTP